MHMTLTFESCKTVSSDSGNKTLSKSIPKSPERMLALLKYLDSEECYQRISEGLNVLDLDSLAEGSELLLDQYIEGVLKGLYVYRGSDMIFIRCWKDCDSSVAPLST
jgi:hypothetical protein